MSNKVGRELGEENSNYSVTIEREIEKYIYDEKGRESERG